MSDDDYHPDNVLDDDGVAVGDEGMTAFVTAVIQNHPVLLEKSMAPHVRNKKKEAELAMAAEFNLTVQQVSS